MAPRKQVVKKEASEDATQDMPAPRTRAQKRLAETPAPDEPEPKRVVPVKAAPKKTTRRKTAPSKGVAKAPRVRKPTKSQLAKQQREAEQKLNEEEDEEEHTPSSQPSVVVGRTVSQQDGQEVEQPQDEIVKDHQVSTTRSETSEPPAPRVTKKNKEQELVLAEGEEQEAQVAEEEQGPRKKENKAKKIHAAKKLEATEEQQDQPATSTQHPYEQVWGRQEPMIPAKRFGGQRKKKQQQQAQEQQPRKRSADAAGISHEDDHARRKSRVLERDFKNETPQWVQRETSNGGNVVKVTKTPGMAVGEAKVAGKVTYKIDLPSTADLDPSVKRHNTEQIRRMIHALAQRISEDDVYALEGYPTMVSFVLGPDRVERCLPTSDLESSGLVQKKIVDKAIGKPIVLETVSPDTFKYYTYYKNARFNLLDPNDRRWTPNILVDMYALGVLLEDIPFKDTMITTLIKALRATSRAGNAELHPASLLDFTPQRIRPIFDNSTEATAGRRLFTDLFVRIGMGLHPECIPEPSQWGEPFLAALKDSYYRVTTPEDTAAWPGFMDLDAIDWPARFTLGDGGICKVYHDHHNVAKKCAYKANLKRKMQADRHGG